MELQTRLIVAFQHLYASNQQMSLRRRWDSFQERAISKHDVVVMLTTHDLMPRKVKVLTYCEKRTVQTFILVD